MLRPIFNASSVLAPSAAPATEPRMPEPYVCVWCLTDAAELIVREPHEWREDDNVYLDLPLCPACALVWLDERPGAVEGGLT